LRQAYDYWQDQPGNYLEKIKEEKRKEKKARGKGKKSSSLASFLFFSFIS